MSTICDGYQLKGLLGKGSLGKVFKSQRLDNLYVMKQILKEDIAEETLKGRGYQSLIKAMKSAKAMRLLPLATECQDDFHKYAVTAFLPIPNLTKYVIDNPTTSLRDSLIILADVLRGLQDLHTARILHLNLKPNNIFVSKTGDQPKIILSDYGMFQIEDDRTNLLNIEYAAPELLVENGETFAAEVWSVGVVLYYMLTGDFPFTKSEVVNKQVYRKCSPFSFRREISKLKQKKAFNVQETDDLEDFFERIFRIEFETRIGIHTLKTHRLLKEYFKPEEITESEVYYSNPPSFTDNKQKSKIKSSRQGSEMYSLPSVMPGLSKVIKGPESKINPFSKKDIIQSVEEVYTFQKQKNIYCFEADRNYLLLEACDKVFQSDQYFPDYLKYAFCYVVSKLFIVYGRQLKAKYFEMKIPVDSPAENLRWTEFFASPLYIGITRKLERSLVQAQENLEDMYNQCMTYHRVKLFSKIPEFSTILTDEVAELSFSGVFKEGYRRTTSLCYGSLLRVLARQQRARAEGQNINAQVYNIHMTMIKVFICHSINRMFEPKMIPVLYDDYFKWKQTNNIDGPQTFDFVSFMSWLGSAQAEVLSRVTTIIISQIFTH